MTVEEYLTSSRRVKISYRLLRNPLILFGLAPLFLFFVLERFPSSKCKPRERRSVYLMNFTLLLWGVVMSLIFGFLPWLILQTVMMGVAGGCGIWLFYVQHQFEDTYWAQGKEWDFTAAAMEGSSYYKLPKIMQWFSGNIGFHHIHHLNPMVPNYNLEKCHHSDPFFQVAPELNLWTSIKTIKFRLWDEANGKMISFRELKNQLCSGTQSGLTLSGSFTFSNRFPSPLASPSKESFFKGSGSLIVRRILIAVPFFTFDQIRGKLSQPDFRKGLIIQQRRE